MADTTPVAWWLLIGASAAFTGASREVTVDTTLNTLRIHDGSTAGGHLAG